MTPTDRATRSGEKLTLREGDVFDFHWNEGAWERARTSMGHSDLNWCFEGQLVAKPTREGTLQLVDSYWGSGSDNKTMTLKQAERDGTLTFLCNLNDVEPVQDYNREYFNPSEVFRLRSQHGLRCSWVKLKGAERDRDTMLNVVRERLSKQSAKIESDACYNARALAQLEVALYLLEKGDTSVSIPEVRP